MTVIWNTTCTKCIFWTGEIKSMFIFKCYCVSFQDMQSFLEFLVSVVNHYNINGLHLFSDRSKWFCLQRSHHHVMPLAQISLTLFRLFSLSFIASGRCSGLHPVSSHSCCMYARAGRPAFARPYSGVHRSICILFSNLRLKHSIITNRVVSSHMEPM